MKSALLPPVFVGQQSSLEYVSSHRDSALKRMTPFPHGTAITGMTDKIDAIVFENGRG